MVSNNQLLEIRKKLQALKESGELNGEGADRSENLHRLFMYPAMMVPAAQYAVIKAVSICLPEGAWAMDPFMGSGTSLMSCMEFGFNVYGQRFKMPNLEELATKGTVFNQFYTAAPSTAI